MKDEAIIHRGTLDQVSVNVTGARTKPVPLIAVTASAPLPDLATTYETETVSLWRSLPKVLVRGHAQCCLVVSRVRDRRSLLSQLLRFNLRYIARQHKKFYLAETYNVCNRT